MAFQIPETISCLICRDQDSGLWNGHCLDFDIVTSAATPQRAWEHLKTVVKAHIEHCFSHSVPVDTFAATGEHWSTFQKLACSQPNRNDKIEVRLVARRVPDRNEFWIKGVELAAAESTSVH